MAATAKGPTAKGETAKGPMAKGPAAKGPTANGGDGQGGNGQGGYGKGANSKGADDQGADGQGANGQGANGQGADGQGASAKGATAKGAHKDSTRRSPQFSRLTHNLQRRSVRSRGILKLLSICFMTYLPPWVPLEWAWRPLSIHTIGGVRKPSPAKTVPRSLLNPRPLST